MEPALRPINIENFFQNDPAYQDVGGKVSDVGNVSRHVVLGACVEVLSTTESNFFHSA
jgi:hypothetical protein